jgi:hypothetical protein
MLLGNASGKRQLLRTIRLIEPQPLRRTVRIVRFACKDALQSRKVTGGGGGPAKKRRTMGANSASASVG